MYKVLYRKYRPHFFKNVIGQKHIVNSLKNSIEKNQINHAYLFFGSRGTGKTTIARIFARAINSVDYSQENIWKYEEFVNDTIISDIDLIEMDAASNNGVDDVRKIINISNFLPVNNKYKIFIIDEVHMFSKEAFNALLKIIEEPPKNVVFLLATTEPHKIPITVLSRLQKLKFHNLSHNEIYDHLIFILDNEKISYEKKAINLIARIAKGGMRDAISLVDQVSVFTSEKITLKSVFDMLGIISNQQKINIINSFIDKNALNIIKQIKQILNESIDVYNFVEEIINLLNDFIIFNLTKNSKLISIIDKEEINYFKININQAYKINKNLIKLLKQIKKSSQPHNIIEYWFLRIYFKFNKELLKQNHLQTNNENQNFINMQDKQKAFEIVNLLMLSSKSDLVEANNIFQKFKSSSIEKNDFINHFIKNINRIPVAGKNFVIFASTDKNKVLELNKMISIKNNFQSIEKIFNKAIHIFIFNKDELEKGVKKWRKLKKTNNLPLKIFLPEESYRF